MRCPIVFDKWEHWDNEQAFLERKAKKVPGEFRLCPDIGRESEISTEGMTMEDEWGYRVYVPWIGLRPLDQVFYMEIACSIEAQFMSAVVMRAVWKGIVNGIYHCEDAALKSAKLTEVCKH